VEKLWRNEPPRNRKRYHRKRPDRGHAFAENAYSGVFKVIGDIYTTKRHISSNLDTTGNSNTAGNSTISGSLTVDSYALVKNKLYLGDNDTDAVSDSTNPFFYATQLFTGLNTTTPTAPLDISINTECGVFFHSSSTINKTY
jgi:hypothetical protein